MKAALNIAICGCGPAGLAAAILLRRAGHEVQVFERFATPRPVGSGLILQPTGLSVLNELGLIEQLTTLGAKIERLFGKVVPSGRVVLDVRYSALGSGWSGLAVHRATLFDALYAAAVRCGVVIKFAHAVASIERNRDKAALLTSDGQRHDGYDLVVDALGANSPLAAGRAPRTVLPYGALWANVPWPATTAMHGNALEQRYFRASRMAGILPIGQLASDQPRLAAFFWSIKRDQVIQCRAAGFDKWKTDVIQLWPDIEPVIESLCDFDQLTFAQYDHFTQRTPHSERLVHIGDAARATSPQLGQGANMALLDALALARALGNSNDVAGALRDYARMRQWHVRLFQRASAAFTPFYQSDSKVLPMIRDQFMAPLSRLPIANNILARLVSGMTVSPLARTDFKPWRIDVQ
jgi:salicylate hydroxylase